MELKEELKKECALTDEQSAEVTAGEEDGDFNKYTLMWCKVCKIERWWAGDYKDGRVFDCPACKSHAFTSKY